MRIDCQSHLFCPEIIARLERRSSDPRVFTRDGTRFLQMSKWLRKIPPRYLDVDGKLAAMDESGIQLAALSINDPGPEWFGNEGPDVARIANDFIAGHVARRPNRFFGLCVLPLQDTAASLAELERCAAAGFKGVLLYSNLAGRFPDDKSLWPVYERAAALGMPLLLHPALPVTVEYVHEYEMTASLGNMFENTIALTRIIMSGLLDAVPGLQVVCPHLGGTLPYIIGRLEHQVKVLKRGPTHLTRSPLEYLRLIWFDVVSPLPEAMRFCANLLGTDKLLFASDDPWVSPAAIVDCVERAGFDADEKARIYHRNAQRLFRLRPESGRKPTASRRAMESEFL
jgi:predicted TIM-barrel fold metal-dependent hydrolase